MSTRSRLDGSLPSPAARSEERMATRRRYLMCPPRHFAVEYRINPWMDPTVPADPDRAMAQWSALVELYQSSGHEVELVEPHRGLPDMVFAANSATVVDGVALGARFAVSQRAAEADHFRRWLVGRGYRYLVPDTVNEGEGDLLFAGRFMLAGTGFRTEPAAHPEAQATLGIPVITLRLIDPRFYHLDTCLVVLDVGTGLSRPVVAYYPDAFDAASRRLLARIFPDAVIANAADAECLGLNAISDGRRVILPKEAGRLAAAVAERGFEPLFVDISELRRAGGGPKCCTLELR